MPTILRRSLIAILAVFALSACETASYGHANNHAGADADVGMCASVRNFVRAPLDEDGARRAWFYPFGGYADGSFDVYAPMGSNPSDDYSRAFYRNGVGQLTHYQVMPRFAYTVSDCLQEDDGFSRVQYAAPDGGFRASYRDASTNRRIEVSATEQRSAFLVVAVDWRGDVAAELQNMLEAYDGTQD